MTQTEILVVVASFGLAATLTPVMGWLARRAGAIDDPSSAPDRKRHTRPIPLFGGLAIILSSNIVWWWVFRDVHLTAGLPEHFLWGLLGASLLIMIGGIWDDRFGLKPSAQLAWSAAAVLAAIMAGIGITFITNPFGGVIFLDQVRWTIWHWRGAAYHLTLWASLFTFAWLMITMYTTKILDGLDGLVSGFGVIGSVIVFLLTLRPEVSQPGVAIMALTLAGASAGFLVWNWHPAKIFLGESGSLFIGFTLGVLAIISGGKIATALLILGLPILDLLWVIIQRFRRRASPLRTADRSHLHFRLLDAGLSTRQTVSMLYAVTATFGLATLIVSGKMKVLVLGLLFFVMVTLVGWVSSRLHRSPQPSK